MNENIRYLAGMTILYAEDDVMARDEVVFSLEPYVRRILAASDGEEGLALFEKERPDIVLTDIQMPRMNGIEMAKAIREVDRSVPIVVTTAFNDSDYLLRSIEAGVTAYETKPLDLMRLIGKLAKIAKHLTLEQENRRMHQILARYQTAIDESTQIMHLDRDLRIVHLNERLRAALAADAGDFLKHSLFERFDTESAEERRRLEAAFRQRGEWQGSLKYADTQGAKTRYFRVTMFPMENVFDDGAAYSLFMQDITELMRYRQFLQKELSDTRRSLDENLNYLNQYRKIIDEATAICTFLPDGTIRRTDTNFEQMLCGDKEEFAGRNFFEICRGMRENLPDFITRSCETGEFVHLLTRCQKDSRHKERIAHSIFRPIFTLDGEIEEIIGIHQDITELIELNEEIKSTQKEILFRLGAVAENHSQETGLHVRRVAEYSKRLAGLYGLSPEECEIVYAAAPMHDIGKLAIPDHILNKPGPLTDEEFDIMKTHTLKGEEMFAGSERPFMKTAAIIAGQHHENYDGSGYPRGLRGETIHIYGRIVAIADVFDALSFRRVYKEAWPLERILDFMQENRGKKFDPALIDLFFRHIDDFLRIRKIYS